MSLFDSHHYARPSESIPQPIHPAAHHPCRFHFMRFRRYSRHKRRNSALWPSPLEPPPSHRSMDQQTCSVLCLVIIRIGYPRNEHISQLTFRRERHDSAIPQVHQHSQRSGNMRFSGWLGALSLGDIGYVSLVLSCCSHG